LSEGRWSRIRPGSTIHKAPWGDRVLNTVRRSRTRSRRTISAARSDLEHHYSGACRWWEAKHVAEIPIQRDQRPPFGGADFEQPVVCRPLEPLIADSNHIVSGAADHIGRAAAEILVELEFHPAFSVGTGTTRSRAASAPYAIAANTSSWTSSGYSASSSASDMPSERKSRTSETQIRVPLMQGLPPQILGSMAIRFRRGLTFLRRMLFPEALPQLNGSI
jgi:hypothetical protein